MENSKKNISFNYIWQRYGTVGILIGLLAILAILKPGSILDPKSISQILTQSSVNILLAVGEFFAILIAGIDLSVGSVAALTGMIVAKLMVNGTSPSVAILVGIFTGAFIGFINGILVNKTKLHPFIITLGTQSIFRGLTLIISKARSVFGFPVSFTKGISNKILGIPVPVIIALVVALLLAYFTTRCKAGRNIYALGGNKDAAWYSGVNVELHTLIVFIISGLCAGIAGIVLLGRVGAAEPAAATGFETYAIAAAIIGGTSFFGGKGKIFGVVVGGLIIGVINYGMTVLTVPSSYQQIVMGALIVISVAMDRFVANRK
ncbi:MAG: D-allose ABC transporter permease [Clostridiales bacterium]|nr:D-allose ABC transporter permease [Clostridiales bacterium]